MPVPRATGKVSDIDSCGLSLGELQELWLGAHPTTGSLFHTREELVAAWEAGRAVVMRLWAHGGRRPRGWWEFDTDVKYPGYDRERSTLWKAGVLSDVETIDLMAEWRREFEVAKGKSAKERREHYEFHDIPDELIERWQGARKRRKRQPAISSPVNMAPEKAPGVASGTGSREEDVSGASVVQPADH